MEDFKNLPILREGGLQKIRDPSWPCQFIKRRAGMARQAKDSFRYIIETWGIQYAL